MRKYFLTVPFHLHNQQFHVDVFKNNPFNHAKFHEVYNLYSENEIKNN